MLCLNEYGDFLSDMASGLAGSIGTAASASYAFNEIGNVSVSMFDPAGGTAPDIAGQDKANPTAALLAFSMLLEHAGKADAGQALRLSLLSRIGEGRSTRDLGGTLGTREFTQAVIDGLEA